MAFVRNLGRLGQGLTGEYEQRLAVGSKYDFLVERAAQTQHSDPSLLKSISFDANAVRGMSMMDMAETSQFIARRGPAAEQDANLRQDTMQVAKFAKLSGMSNEAAAKSTSQLSTVFGLNSSYVTNAIEHSRTTYGGVATESDIINSLQAAAPYLKKDKEGFAVGVATSQILEDYGVSADRGTRQLLQHMLAPDVPTALKMKKVQDANKLKADPTLTQEQLDSQFTSEGYWQFQQESAQVQAHMKQQPLQLAQERLRGGLTEFNENRFVTTQQSYQKDVMTASGSSLSVDALQYRIQQRNLDLEAVNLGRQSKLIDLDEKLTQRNFAMQEKQLAVQGMQLGFATQQLGIKQEQFGLQKQENALTLRSDAMDLSILKIKASTAGETSDLEMKQSNIEFAAKRRELGIQKRELPLRRQQLDIESESAQMNVQWQKEGVEFKKWYDTQMYGTVGSDRSYRAYLATQEGAQNEKRDGGWNTEQTTTTTRQKVAAAPVMGLQNQEFYAGIQHQMSQLHLGRSSFRSEAAYAENVQYLKKQTEFYERRMKVEDAAREFSYRQSDQQVKLAEKSYEVQKQLLALQKERLDGQISDAEILIPIQQRLLELNHLVEAAQIAQMPERIAIEIARIGLKGQGMALSEKGTALSLKEEAAMLSAQKSMLVDQKANLILEKEKQALLIEQQKAALKVQTDNLKDQQEIQARQAGILYLQQGETAIRAALMEQEMYMLDKIAKSRAQSAQGLLGTDNGKPMDFVAYFKGLVEQVQLHEKDPSKGISREAINAANWTDPALQAMFAAMEGKDGKPARWDEAYKYATEAGQALNANSGRQKDGTSPVDKNYTGVADAGGLDDKELQKWKDLNDILNKASQEAQDTYNWMLKSEGTWAGLTKEFTGFGGKASEYITMLSSITAVFSSALAMFSTWKAAAAIGTLATAVTGGGAAGGMGAGIGAAASGLTGAAITAAAMASVAVIVGGTAIGIIMNEVWNFVKNGQGGVISSWLQDRLRTVNPDGSVAVDAGGDAEAEAMTKWSKAQGGTSFIQETLAQQLLPLLKRMRDDPTHVSTMDKAAVAGLLALDPKSMLLLMNTYEALRDDKSRKPYVYPGTVPPKEELGSANGKGPGGKESTDISDRHTGDPKTDAMMGEIAKTFSKDTKKKTETHSPETDKILKDLFKTTDTRSQAEFLELQRLKGLAQQSAVLSTSQIDLLRTTAKAINEKGLTQAQKLDILRDAYAKFSTLTTTAVTTTGDKQLKELLKIYGINIDIDKGNKSITKELTGFVTAIKGVGAGVGAAPRMIAEDMSQAYQTGMKNAFIDAWNAINGKGTTTTKPPPPPGDGKGNTGGAGGGAGGKTGGKGYDIGIIEVPADEYAKIHKGEAVLTVNEAAAYRAGRKEMMGQQPQGVAKLLQSVFNKQPYDVVAGEAARWKNPGARIERNVAPSSSSHNTHVGGITVTNHITVTGTGGNNVDLGNLKKELTETMTSVIVAAMEKVKKR
jgi:hypothetical protein